MREVAELLIDDDPRVLLVIDRVREVTEPISEVLRKLGIRSLREAVREPTHVVGHREIQEASDKLTERLDALRSPGFRMTLLKRLTLVIKNGVVENVFYPVFPPDKNAGEVVAWLRGTRA